MGQRTLVYRKSVKTEKSNSSMLTSNARSKQQMETVNAVLNNPLLLEKIVKYSVHDSKGKNIDKKVVISLRLVNKTWLQGASNILKKSDYPVVCLVIGCTNGINLVNNEEYDNKKGDILNNFVSIFSRNSVYSILPVHLHIKPYYFKRENSRNFQIFFEKCGVIVSKLSVDYPLDGHYMTLKIGDSNFPLLQNFKFTCEPRRGPEGLRRVESVPEYLATALAFLKSCLMQFKCLQHFTFTNGKDTAINTTSLILPSTVKRLSFGVPLTENDVILLTQSQLPNLETLDLEIRKRSDEQRNFKVLEHLRLKLTSLYLNYGNAIGNDHTVFLKFPKMEKLKFLKISGNDFEISPEIRYVWPSFLPKLTHFEIDNLKETQFLSLVQGVNFKNVDIFKFGLFYDVINIFKYTLSPNVKIMRTITDSFPNIQKLNLKFEMNDTSGISYLFRNFTQLKGLRLEFCDQVGNNGGQFNYKLISVLLGISLELATAIVNKTEGKANVSTDNPDSIMNLKELTSFTLRTPLWNFWRRDITKGPLDKYGFDKMPKLRKVKYLVAISPSLDFEGTLYQIHFE